MADIDPGILDTIGTILQSTAAGYAFGEAALFSLDPVLTLDDTLMTAVTTAAKQTSSIAVAVVMPCLILTSVFLSLGCGLLLAAVMMKLWAKVRLRPPWLMEVTTGASVVVGAVTAGVLMGLLPPWIYITAQCILAAVVYAHSNVNETIAALFVIFGSLYLGVVFGSLGLIPGLCLTGVTMLFVSLMGEAAQTANSRRLFFYCSLFAIKGFCIGLDASKAKYGSEEELFLIVNSVIWVTSMSAGLIGAQMGAKATTRLRQDMAGKITSAVAIISSVAPMAILKWRSSLGPRGRTGAMFGAAAAAGFSLGAVTVAGRRNSLLAVLGSIIIGTIAAMQSGGLKVTQLTTSEFSTIITVAAGAFVLSTPSSPFHTGVIPPRDLLAGSRLIIGIGMEMVTAAAESIALGALGAAAFGTAALGRVGSLGILGAVVLSLGIILVRCVTVPQTQTDLSLGQWT